MSFGIIRDKNTAIVTTGIDDLITIDVNIAERIAVELTVDGIINSLWIQARFHSAGEFSTLYSSAESFNNPEGLLIGTSGDLSVLAGHGWFILDTRALDQVRLRASAASDTSVEVMVGG